MARMACGLHVYPLWSLSVEDLLPWRRLYSATSAVQIRAWSPRCAVSSSVFATWKPSLCGSRKRTTRSLLASVTRMTCSFWIASRCSPDDLRELRLARTTPRVRLGTTVQQTNQGRPPASLFVVVWQETHSQR